MPRSVPQSDKKPWSKTHAMHRERRPDDGRAFIRDPESGPARTRDELAELVAEEFVASAIAGEEKAFDDRDETAPEEYGGPYTEEVLPPELIEELAATRKKPPRR